MSSSGSDLSDFYDEPHNEIGSTQKQNGEYQLSKQIKYPRATVFTVQALYAASIDEDGTEHRTCIDGKQRLTSIHL
ncbi:hypothetical protein HHX47_DHR6000091 [Lentinula edodes]|nr:hypothetical protein HHX47_DHR6000091 [Lentinula edodes]